MGKTPFEPRLTGGRDTNFAAFNSRKYQQDISYRWDNFIYYSTFGVPKVEKFEIRISKSETNSNFLMFK